MDIFGVGIFEALLVMVVALIVVGPNKFPDIAKSAGRWFSVARNYAAEVRTDIESATAEIESEVKREQDFADGFIDDLNSMEKEASQNMPKVLSAEPIFETNIDDFKKDNSLIDNTSPEKLDSNSIKEEENTTNE
ncbi:MAG: twin-arginine translocase TatA/TatE family subunit [Dehalococcoidia bacterium]|nr:twin-arginine translocase TatA/TatE family subunit [Dehalococcoidia bacterium]